MSDEQTPPPIPSQLGQDVNPYAPPTTDPTLETTLTVSEAEALRRPNLTHEASIRGIGALAIIVGLLFVAGSFYTPYQSFDVAGLIVAIIFAAIGIGQIIAGLAVRKFQVWARIVCSVFSGFLLLVIIPLGTILGAYFLYVLLGQKGSLIFSYRYQEAMRLTPKLKYRTSTGMWVLLILLIVLLIASITYNILSK